MPDMLSLSLVILLSSIVSGTTGLGGGILLLAFMTPLFPPAILIPLHGIIQLFSNTSRVIISHRKVDVKIFLLFSIGAAIGSLLGSPLTLSIPDSLSKIVLAAAILFFTWFPKVLKSFDFKGKFFVIGAGASFLSLFVGATGPLTAPFFLNSELDKDSFVPTKAACQIPIHLFKVIVYILSGFVLGEWILEIIIAVPIVFAGNYLGKHLTGKLNESLYRNIIKVVISLLVLRMIIKIF